MKKELLLGWFDAYVERARSLARHLLRTDRIKDRPELLATDWRKVCWYDAMWLFELEGIKACGHPGVFDNPQPWAPRQGSSCDLQAGQQRQPTSSMIPGSWPTGRCTTLSSCTRRCWRREANARTRRTIFPTIALS
jgi:hypothetical protein